MTALQAAALWTGLNVALLVYLSVRVGQVRMRRKINLGDGGDDEMIRAIRAQGNYVEYAPLALVGLWGLAMLGAGNLLVHGLGGVFFAGRIAHFLGLGAGVWPAGRFVGTLLTLLALLATAGALVWRSVL